MNRKLARMLLLGCCLAAGARAELHLAATADGVLTITWNGQPVVQGMPGVGNLQVVNYARQPLPPGAFSGWQVHAGPQQVRLAGRFPDADTELRFVAEVIDAEAVEFTFGIAPAHGYVEDFCLSFPALHVGRPPTPLKGFLYPGGKYGPVAATVWRGERWAVGLMLLGLHDTDRPLFSNVGLREQNGLANLVITPQWSGNNLVAGRQVSAYTRRVRLRFAALEPGREYSLTGAPQLWQDYRADLDRAVPLVPPPPFQSGRPVYMHSLYTDARFVTPDNPMGYNPSHWVQLGGNPSELVSARPVTWVQAAAESSAAEMQKLQAQAVILWKTGVSAFGEVNYIAESQQFHPSLEERLPVTVSERWDCLVADATVFTPAGEGAGAAVLGQQAGLLLHVRDPEQIVSVTAAPPAGNAPQAPLPQLRLRLERLVEPLTGKRAGDSVSLTATPVTPRGAAPVQVKLLVRGVERTAINAYLRVFLERGIEIGFLNRADFTWGQPWEQHTQSFDWRSDWQYRMFADRFQALRERFGPRCRWFYLDCFGDDTPAPVMQRLRAEFPDCHFFAEHEYDATWRTLGIFDGPPSPLMLLLNPGTLSLTRTNFFSVDEVRRQIIGNPNVLPMPGSNYRQALLPPTAGK